MRGRWIVLYCFREPVSELALSTGRLIATKRFTTLSISYPRDQYCIIIHRTSKYYEAKNLSEMLYNNFVFRFFDTRKPDDLELVLPRVMYCEPFDQLARLSLQYCRARRWLSQITTGGRYPYTGDMEGSTSCIYTSCFLVPLTKNNTPSPPYTRGLPQYLKLGDKKLEPTAISHNSLQNHSITPNESSGSALN